MMDELLEMDPNLDIDENEMAGEEPISILDDSISPYSRSHSSSIMRMSGQNSIDQDEDSQHRSRSISMSG